jgi:glycosyltransferase involved in cell wall biosynthesis
MRIIFFVHSLRKGGAERLLLQLSNHLLKKNHDIRILQAVDFDEYPEYTISKKESLLKAQEYKWPYALPKLIRHYRKYVRAQNPDLICIFSPLMVIVAALSLMRLKTVHVIQGYGLVSKQKSFKNIIYKALDKISFRILNYNAIVPTNSLKESILGYLSIKSDNVKIVTSGVDSKSLKFNSNIDLENKIIITMLGTVYKEKGQRLAIEAVKQLKKINNNLDFVVKIIGEGSDEKYIKKRIKQNGLKENIVLLGRRDDAFELISSSHIFWHLSQSEGLPLVVMEAMALGVPVIGFDVRGVNDVIRNNQNGYLVKYKDMSAIASYTNSLINDEDCYTRFINAARNEIDEIYNIEKMCINYEEYFLQLCNVKR